MPRFLHNKRGIFLRCKVFNFRSFVSRDIFLVRADDRAFKSVTCRSADGMRNVVGDPVGIGAAWHCYEQVVGLYYLYFVDCETAVNRYGSYCAELTAVECLSENNVCNVHLNVSFLFQSLLILMVAMSA